MRNAAATPPRPTARSGARHKRSTRSSTSSSSASSIRKKRKLHSKLIANDDEKKKANSLRLIDSEMLIRYRKPPGYNTRYSKKDPKDPKFPEIRDYGRKIFKALVAFLRTMHRKKLTLNGHIKARMMLWIASSRSIKLQNVPCDDFSEFTIDGGKKDYDAIADVIEKYLLRDFELPEDMKDWVKLMRANPLENTDLIRYHVALMAPKDKVEHFLDLYSKLCQEKKFGGKNKYKAVISNIPAGDTTKDHVWKTDIGRNKYVEKVFNHMREGYLDNANDLLRLVRNCAHHLLDHSGANKNKKFEKKDMYCMIESYFSGLFHQFQRAMVQAGFNLK